MKSLMFIAVLVLLTGCHVTPVDQHITPSVALDGIELTTVDDRTPDAICSGGLGRTLSEVLLSVSFKSGTCRGTYIRCDEQRKAHVRQLDIHNTSGEACEEIFNSPSVSEVDPPSFSKEDVESCVVSVDAQWCWYTPRQGSLTRRPQNINRMSAIIRLFDGTEQMIEDGCINPVSLLRINTNASDGCYEVDEERAGNNFICSKGFWWNPAQTKLDSINCVPAGEPDPGET